MPMSGWPSEISVAEPKVSGNMQLQQMSVIGFMNRPWQVGPACADGENISSMASTAADAKSQRRIRVNMLGLQEFIDA